MKVSEICVCPVVHPKDVEMKRCLGAKPTHRTCGKVILKEKRVITDDRPEIEYR